MWSHAISFILPEINPYSAISFASMFISLLAFVATQLAARRHEGGDYIARLEARVQTLEKKLEESDAANEILREKIVFLNAALTRRILGDEKTD